MKQFRSLIIIAFSVILFVGNTVGLDVFEHFCTLEKTASYSYLIPLSDDCEDVHEVVSEDSCCAIPEVEDDCCAVEKRDDGCCEDEIIHVHFDLDYSNEYSDLTFVLITEKFHSLEFVLSNENIDETQVIFALHPNPPPLKSSERRSLQQVFIV